MGNQNAVPKDMKPSRSFDPNNTMSQMTVITTRCDKRASSLRMHSCNDILPPMDMSSSNLRKLQSQPLSSPLPSKTRRRSSLLHVKNGVTGVFISSRICKIAAKFWMKNIETLSSDEALEVGCSIFFNMMATSRELKTIMKSRRTQSIESTSIKYLDMMGWLVRHLVSDGLDVHSLLDRLGAVHRQMGITIHHFVPMLKAMHDSFAYYLEEKYSIEVKYAMDELFSFAAQVMTGQNIRQSSYLMEITKQFQGDHIPFLQSLEKCLQSPIGTEYLERFLSQTWCDELVIFLQSLKRFKRLVTNKERFIVAREIIKHSIDPIATFSLNLSYEIRGKMLYDMTLLEGKFAQQEDFEVSVDFFEEIEKDVLRLIINNHWQRFVKDIETLQSKSFELQSYNQ
eukprot:109020_1